MSPEKARIFIAEDAEEWRDGYEELLQREGHTVVVSAATKEEAVLAIEQLGEDEIDVALVDGNMTPHDISGKDGAEIAEAIRERFENVTIISISSLHYPWADLSVSKVNFEKLPEVVTQA